MIVVGVYLHLKVLLTGLDTQQSGRHTLQEDPTIVYLF